MLVCAYTCITQISRHLLISFFWNFAVRLELCEYKKVFQANFRKKSKHGHFWPTFRNGHFGQKFSFWRFSLITTNLSLVLSENLNGPTVTGGGGYWPPPGERCFIISKRAFQGLSFNYFYISTGSYILTKKCVFWDCLKLLFSALLNDLWFQVYWKLLLVKYHRKIIIPSTA